MVPTFFTFLFVVAEGAFRRRIGKAVHSLPEAAEEIAGIGAQGANSVSPLLNHQGRQPEGADHPSIGPEVFGEKTPGSCRVALGCVQAQGNDQDVGLVSGNPSQSLGKGFSVLLSCNVLRERIVDVEPQSR